MTEFLTSCGYADYAERFVELGFDSWQNVELMDRDDLLACGVKLGHVKVNYNSLLQQYQTLGLRVALFASHSSPRFAVPRILCVLFFSHYYLFS